MALVSPYDTALIHEFSRREVVRLLSESLTPTSASPPLIQAPPESFFTSQLDDDDIEPKDGVPSLQACAVHLELLEAFMVLRRRVMLSNALSVTFSCSRNFNSTPENLERIHKEKWQKFVELAVARFKIWLKYIRENFQCRETIQHRFGSMLPPIDILMVLHAFMLSPKEYRAYCAEEAVTGVSMQMLRFPWKVIVSFEAIPKCMLPLKLIMFQHNSLDISVGAYKKDFAVDASLAEVMHTDLLKFLQDPKGMHRGTKNYLSDTPKAATAEIPVKLEWDLIEHFKGESGNLQLSFDLAAAVHRQAKFVDKMCHMLWLRSPAITHTLENARSRYKNFFMLFQRYPGRLIVPTLDIDLVWHTHQLSHTQYYDYCMKEAGRFINHDDKIGKGKLDDSFGEMKGLYYKEFATSYNICLCWDCEAIREAIERKPPKNDKELESLMLAVRKRVTDYRAAEIARRPGVRRNRKVVPMQYTTDDLRAEMYSRKRYGSKIPEARYR